MRVSKLTLSLAVVWAITALGGRVALTAHAGSVGKLASKVPPSWPEGTEIPRSRDHDTVVVFIHPRCSSTQAVLRELERDLAEAARAPGRARPDVHVLVVNPEGAHGEHVRGALWRQADAIPGVDPREDDAREARRFGATHSGHVLAFDESGKLAYSGGITPARGIEGESPARRAFVEALLAPRTHAAVHWPVFGCELENER